MDEARAAGAAAASATAIGDGGAEDDGGHASGADDNEGGADEGDNDGAATASVLHSESAASGDLEGVDAQSFAARAALIASALHVEPNVARAVLRQVAETKDGRRRLVRAGRAGGRPVVIEPDNDGAAVGETAALKRGGDTAELAIDMYFSKQQSRQDRRRRSRGGRGARRAAAVA